MGQKADKRMKARPQRYRLLSDAVVSVIERREGIAAVCDTARFWRMKFGRCRVAKHAWFVVAHMQAAQRPVRARILWFMCPGAHADPLNFCKCARAARVQRHQTDRVVVMLDVRQVPDRTIQPLE